MADGDTPPEGAKDAADKGGAKEPEAKAPEAKGDIEQIASQADKPDAVRNAIQAERDKASAAAKEVAALAKKIKAYEDADKSEKEKLEEAKAEAEKEAASARGELLRLKVASKKGLDPELADRLRGENEKELEADADRLLEKFKPQANGDVDAGRGEGAAGTSMNDLLRGRTAA